MLIPFETLKVIQASAVLLKTVVPHRMSRLRLLKLLYIADRQMLAKTGRPITGDRVVAMDNGPVLSQTYDLIKGREFASPLWNKHLKQSGSQDVKLVEDPGVGELAKHEIEKLQSVAREFGALDDWEVADYTHQFDEWQKNKPPKGSCQPIPLEDLLEAVGMAQHKESLVNDAYRLRTVARLLEDPESGRG